MGRCQRLRSLKRHPGKSHVKGGLDHDPLAPAHPVGLRRSQSPFAAKPPRPKATVLSTTSAYLFRDVPAERRSSQASITRLAMPASDNFPHARGSYAFLLPTSPSTFSTPS
jgi:hypothetical protein